MKKKIFLNTPTAKIDNEFAIFNNQWRFEIIKINAVFITRQATYKRYPICLGILFCIIAAACNSIGCLITGIFFFFIAYLMKAQYILRLKTNIGEVRPLSSTNKAELEEIQKAIEEALMYEEISASTD